MQFCEKGPRLCEVALWANTSHQPARPFLTAYDVGMWMRGELNPNNSAGTSNVEVAYYNSSNVEIGRDVVVSHDPGDLDQTWEEYHGIVTTPANTTSLRVWVTNELNSGWVNYDDAYVIPQDGVKTTVHYQLAGQNVAVAVGADVSYVFSDHLGSTATSWNATSGASSQYYLPFGAIRHSDGLPSDVGYTGQKLDASTGLMFYNARYYDPLIGRFISVDTIVPDPMNPQAWNRYSYVINNPLRYTDPTGHCWFMKGTKGTSCFSMMSDGIQSLYNWHEFGDNLIDLTDDYKSADANVLERQVGDILTTFVMTETAAIATLATAAAVVPIAVEGSLAYIGELALARTGYAAAAKAIPQTVRALGLTAQQTAQKAYEMREALKQSVRAATGPVANFVTTKAANVRAFFYQTPSSFQDYWIKYFNEPDRIIDGAGRTNTTLNRIAEKILELLG